MKIRTLIGVIAVPIVAGTALAGVAFGSDNHSGQRTVTFTEINHPDTDVDLDLGPTGLSLGDEQIFHATLQQKGSDVGDVYGVGTVVQKSDSGLSSQVVSTAVFPNGTFHLAGHVPDELRGRPASNPARRGHRWYGCLPWRHRTMREHRDPQQREQHHHLQLLRLIADVGLVSSVVRSRSGCSRCACRSASVGLA